MRRADWLDKYPQVQALLQREDDEMDYTRQDAAGVEEGPRRPAAVGGAEAQHALRALCEAIRCQVPFVEHAEVQQSQREMLSVRLYCEADYVYTTMVPLLAWADTHWRVAFLAFLAREVTEGVGIRHAEHWLATKGPGCYTAMLEGWQGQEVVSLPVPAEQRPPDMYSLSWVPSLVGHTVIPSEAFPTVACRRFTYELIVFDPHMRTARYRLKEIT